ncbi:CHAT domain-containing protein [Amycolatopsis sp. NPDC058278]|uniref:CHAT domain-containing protein n=1 Tax=Amycolatopsis sp. NPDC058278 TaxID=3346417 RepID=UPI0036DC44FA
MTDPTVDEIRRARDELDQVIEEIQRVPGFETFLATPTMDDVAAAADQDPLVYLTAAEPGGLALIVSGGDVTHVPLDGLTTAALSDVTSEFLSAHAVYRPGPEAEGSAWEDCLAKTSAWLYDEVMGPVVTALDGRSSAVLVAGGLLGLLPIHAARTADGTRPTGYRYVLDDVEVSYIPNARALTAARSNVERTPIRDDRLVTVIDPPRDRPGRPLTRSQVEVEAAVAGFPGSAPPITGSAATADAVRTALEQADVAHFACHGIAELGSPLDSRILLAGTDDLRLRDLLTMRLRLRLAVLSACETLPPGTDLPDEVVSLPTGLLQAGVGGVVASMWEVPDRPTAMLMVEFHRLWRHEGCAPVTALRRAQQWLRDTTNGEKVEAYRQALDAGAGWLPPRAADDLMLVLQFLPPDRREQDTLGSWGAFAYVGA